MYKIIALFTALLVTCSLCYAGEKGYLGITFSVEGTGTFLNPVLKTIRIDKVTPNSPAARSGIETGDLLVEIEGHTVDGAKANELKPYMDREIGQTVHLVVKKASGELKGLSIVAGPKPE